jgi:GNAT superfamily N-acetyltransferase
VRAGGSLRRADRRAPATGVIFRRLRWPHDLDAVQRIDTSFRTAVVLEVVAGPGGFTIGERAADPVFEKRYLLPAADLSGEGSLCFVAEREGGVAGVAVLRHEEWNRTALLSHLYVDARSRGKGVGAGLLAHAAGAAGELDVRAVRVETQSVNPGAVRFYQARGFVITGLDTSLYDPMDAPGEVALFLTRGM